MYIYIYIHIYIYISLKFKLFKTILLDLFVLFVLPVGFPILPKPSTTNEHRIKIIHHLSKPMKFKLKHIKIKSNILKPIITVSAIETHNNPQQSSKIEQIQ